MLSSLPESLDETYERMLCNINYHLIEDARRILTLLCFASRPLTVQELIDGVAVETNSPIGLNRKRRLQDSNGIRDICGGFIDIRLYADSTTETYDIDLESDASTETYDMDLESDASTVQIAHFSVQEYLESERIRSQKAAKFGLTSDTAHAEIAEICLIYLLEPGLSRSDLDESILEEYPLATFAAERWHHHYRKTVKPAPGLDDYILRLFQCQASFTTWVKIHNEDGDWNLNISDFDRPLDDIPAPIYYASLLGLDQVLHELIHTEELESSKVLALSIGSKSKVAEKVNAQGGDYGNALNGAAYHGHIQVMQMLLDRGANVNAQGEYSGNALQAASYSGHDKLVHMLLDRGADVNAQGGEYGNALQAALYRGHKKLVQMLLDRGADVNAQGGEYSNALQAAAYRGHNKIVQMLLDREADVNAQGGYSGNALQAASYGGYDKSVQMLLDRGANVNAQGGEYGNALQAALYRGHKKLVQMLLDRGADVNAQGKRFGNALQAALCRAHNDIVQMLLDRGTDVNAQGGEYGNALQAASYSGYDKLVQMLLDRGADVNAQGGYYGNALQAASRLGQGKIVQMLLDKMNAEDIGNHWRIAVSSGDEQLAELLQERYPAICQKPIVTEEV